MSARIYCLFVLFLSLQVQAVSKKKSSSKTSPYFLLADISGHLSPPGLGIGAQGGVFLKKNINVGVSYMAMGVSYLNFELVSHLSTLKSEYFITESFYINLGLGQRSINLKHDSFESTKTASISSWGVSTGIGNRWRWEYVSIGCEWITLFYPLMGSKKIPKIEDWFETTNIKNPA